MSEWTEVEQWCDAHATSQLSVSVDGVATIERCFGDTLPGDAADVGSIQKNVICLVIAALVGRGAIDLDNHAYHLVKKALAELTGQTTQELYDADPRSARHGRLAMAQP